MGKDSKIEWTEHTFNPWWGCMKVSPACDHCYAETFAKRLGQDVWGPKAEYRTFGEKHWAEPRRWDRQAAEAGKPARVFCASMADVFDNRAPEGERERLWQLIRETPNLIWLLLTKRPQNFRQFIPADWGQGYPNVWLGTTIENEKEAGRRMPYFLAIPAPLHFVSAEPLLGPIDLHNLSDSLPGGFHVDALTGNVRFGGREVSPKKHPIDPAQRHMAGRGTWSKIGWVIVGGESGPGARPMHPGWARSLRDQCAAVGVPFLFKQWGSVIPIADSGYCDAAGGVTYELDDDLCDVDYDVLGRGVIFEEEGQQYVRFSHKRTGRMLDKRVHDGVPGEAA